jgi:hypothetical protein
MILRQPATDVGRHQKRLLTITADKAQAHARMPLTRPDSTDLRDSLTRKRHSCERRGLPRLGQSGGACRPARVGFGVVIRRHEALRLAVRPLVWPAPLPRSRGGQHQATTATHAYCAPSRRRRWTRPSAFGLTAWPRCRRSPYGELARYCDFKLACELPGRDGVKYAHETYTFYAAAFRGSPFKPVDVPVRQ